MPYPKNSKDRTRKTVHLEEEIHERLKDFSLQTGISIEFLVNRACEKSLLLEANQS